MSTFTPDGWARSAGIPLATAIVHTEDLVDQLAEHIDSNRYRLTARGRSVLRALTVIPVQEDAA